MGQNHDSGPGKGRPRGLLSLVLHAHLPFVRHPEHEHALEENWLFEAVTEAYIPVIQVLERLAADGVPYRVTVSMTPTLVSMLQDDLLKERYLRRVGKLIELADREITRTEWEPRFNPLARMYAERFHRARWLFESVYGGDLLAPIRRLQDSGYVEVMGSAATHAYLPLMDLYRDSIRAQVRVGLDACERAFGRRPRGFWLPECGYHPGHDSILAEEGVRYFLTDAHGILHAVPRPRYGTFAPVHCPSGVAAFARDIESSKQVWSAREGYPGDFDYREFYRDIAYDLDYDYLAPYMPVRGVRTDTGMKYYRVTGHTEDKQPYDPSAALWKAQTHAGNFMFNRERQVEYLAGAFDRMPIVVAPYDAELFGHWWFEGPEWLDSVLRKIAFDQDVVRLATPSDYLDIYRRNQVAQPSLSSWGYKGYNEVWLEGSNDWIYRYIHTAAARMTRLAQSHPSADGVLARALNQAARELMLAQSSDWAFIMKAGTVTSYAVRRTVTHVGRFLTLAEQIESRTMNEAWLARLEARDNLFPAMDYRAFLGGPPVKNRIREA